MKTFKVGVFYCLLLGCATLSEAASDFQLTVTNNSIIDWRLVSVSSTKTYAGSLVNAFDVTLNLIKGKRYAITNQVPIAHIFQVIAAGSPDIVLLSQGLGGALESDPDIGWVEVDANTVEFTVTQSLIDGMRQSGHTPGYRCGLHPFDMRGAFAIFGDGVQIANPIAARIARGTVTIELQTVIANLISPLGALQPDDGTNRLFIYDQAGKVWIVENGVPSATPFLDVSGRLVGLSPDYDERGLLGFAFHPDFVAHPKVYTYTSEPVAGAADFTVPNPSPFDHQSVIAEWTVDAGDPNLIDPASRREILRIDEPQFNHNAGALRFGPYDGFLYIALGDGGAGDDQGDGHAPDGNGQDTSIVLGKILRIDVDGTNSANGRYGIPADNPFVGLPPLDEIWAYGFRNPYSMTFDRATNNLFVGDAGQNFIEEIDQVVRGGNHGWRLKEGSFFFDPNGAGDGFVTTVPVLPLPPDLIDPIAEYDHNDGSVVVGGFVYRGALVPVLRGRFIAGDFGTSFATPSGRLFYLDDAGAVVEFQIGTGNRALGLWLKGFGQDRDGEVYVCGSQMLGPTGSTGVVLKIISASTTTHAGGHWNEFR